MRRQYNHVVIAPVLVLIAALLFGLTALAHPLSVPPPDSISIDDVELNRNLLESDDVLLRVRYNIAYASPPTAPASQIFVLRLVDGTTEVGSAIPYSSGTFGNGYGQGIISMYWAASASPKPTWNSNYSLRLEMSPSAYPPTPPPTPTPTATPPTPPSTWQNIYNVTSANYCTSCTTQILARVRLYNVVKADAVILSEAFSLALLQSASGGDVLTANGELYFGNAIPALSSLCPACYAAQTAVVIPTVEATPSGTPYGDDRSITAGTPLERLGSGLFQNVLVLFGAIGMMGFVGWRSHNLVVGLVFGALPVLGLFSYLRILSFTFFMLIVALVSGFFVAWVLWLKPGGE